MNPRVIVAQRLGCQGHQCRSHALATTGDNMVSDLIDQDDVGLQFVSDQLVNGAHVGGNRRQQFGEFHSFRGQGDCADASRPDHQGQPTVRISD